MKKLTLAVATIAFLAPFALSAAPFEGKITMTTTDPRGETMPMIMTVKSGKTRMDVEAQGHSMSMIMDSAKDSMTILIHEQQMYMVQPMPKPPAATATDDTKVGDVTIEKTGEHEKILGYDATKYLAKTKDATAELWMTDQLGTFMGFGSGGGNPFGGGRPKKPPVLEAWQDAFRGKETFPLRSVSSSSDGKRIMKMEVTAIDKTPVADSVFAAPSDYHDMAEMMRGAGMPPGMRPPGR
jgi:hypothetical protein